MRSWNDYKKTMVQPDSPWLAAKDGDLARMSRLLEAGFDINAKDHRGYSPLMLAAYAGNLEMSEFLLSRGADPDSPDASGNSVLMGVCFKGNLELARLLKRAGANLHHKNQVGMDAVDIASTFGRKDLIAFLRSEGIGRKSGNRLFNLVRLLFSRRRRAKPS